MAYKAVIPYESLDPLTIGASGDEDKRSSRGARRVRGYSSGLMTRPVRAFG